MDEWASGSPDPLPEWLPRGARSALVWVERLRFPPNPDFDALLERLTYDARMKRVWRELLKRKRLNHRSTDHPHHIAQLPDAIRSWAALASAERGQAKTARGLGDEALARQYDALAAQYEKLPPNFFSGEPSAPEMEQLALAGIFVAAVRICSENLRPIKRSELDAKLTDLHASGAEAIAKEYDRQARLPENERMIVERQRSDPTTQAFVVQLAAVMNETYGDQMPGLIAIFGNVGFNRDDLSRKSVKGILKRSA